jgi:hypothetical protein
MVKTGKQYKIYWYFKKRCFGSIHLRDPLVIGANNVAGLIVHAYFSIFILIASEQNGTEQNGTEQNGTERNGTGRNGMERNRTKN